MYARVMSNELEPSQIDTFITMIRDQVIPRASKLHGIEGGCWLADRESGGVMGITLFDSEKSLTESQETADRTREEVSRAAGLTVPAFRNYEVIGSVGDALMLAKGGRVTTGQVKPTEIDTFVHVIHDQVIPRASRLPGFQGGYWLADRESGHVLGVTLFDGEASLRATADAASAIRDEASRAVGQVALEFRSYEVVATTGRSESLAA
jgi:hypothetical protein